MKKINLRELYPDVYTTDFFVDVTEEVMETIRAAERAETAYELSLIHIYSAYRKFILTRYERKRN